MREKEHTEMASIIPQVHLSRGLDVYQTRRPVRLEVGNKAPSEREAVQQADELSWVDSKSPKETGAL